MTSDADRIQAWVAAKEEIERERGPMTSRDEEVSL